LVRLPKPVGAIGSHSIHNRHAQSNRANSPKIELKAFPLSIGVSNLLIQIQRLAWTLVHVFQTMDVFRTGGVLVRRARHTIVQCSAVLVMHAARACP
jgi:hypothetical protein